MSDYSINHVERRRWPRGSVAENGDTTAWSQRDMMWAYLMELSLVLSWKADHTARRFSSKAAEFQARIIAPCQDRKEAPFGRSVQFGAKV